MPLDVFISYSSKDADVAQTLCSALEANRLRCWIAPRDIVPGSGWSGSIITAIHRCRLVVLLYSEHSNVSVQVHREIERAIDKNLPIVPFRIDASPLSSEMEFYISTAHWLNAYPPPIEPYLEKLIAAVRSLIAQMPLSPNLPRQLTSFIGREKEIQEVEERLETSCLVTLTGSGGSGKTRLALQVAEGLAREFEDGVWLTELASLVDANLVISTVARTFGLREEPGRPFLETLLDYLKSRRLLLVLDNCEHLLDACANLVDTILKACPNVKILATSREALGIGGESRYQVPSLSTPDWKQKVTPESLTQYEAARLFVERAISVQSSFTVTDLNASPLAQICHRLDGIPLAIELAAARVRTLSIEDINTRLDRRFRLLTGGSRTALPRQQTLQALIDWSYDLLNDQEKTLLARLSVFVGGWTLEVAEKVCSGEGIEDWEVLDLLTSLADKSLVLAEEKDGSMRYRLLETVRQYAGEKLTKSGDEEEETLRERHQTWYLVLAQEAEPRLSGPEQGEWLERLETEHDNLRAALSWSLRTEEADRGKRERSQLPMSDAQRLVPAALLFCGALQRFWWTRGHLAEGLTYCKRALKVNGAQEQMATRATALNGAGALAYFQSDYASARAYFEESLMIQREIGDLSGIAASLNNLGSVAKDQGDYASARANYEESLEIQREIGDRSGIAALLSNLGIVARTQGDYASALVYYEESLAIRREIGDRQGIATSLNNLGNVAHEQGDNASARVYYEECLAISREIGDRQGIAASLGSLGNVAHEQGDNASARVYYEECLSISREIGARRGIATSLNNLGNVVYEQGDNASARVYYEESLAIQREIRDRLGIALSLGNLGLTAYSLGDYASARAYNEESLAIQREIGDRLGIAYSLEAFADLIAVETPVAAETGVDKKNIVRARKAARLWGAAQTLREQIGAPLSGTEQAELEQKIAAARERLGEADWEAAWAEGCKMTMEQAIEYALNDAAV